MKYLFAALAVAAAFAAAGCGGHQQANGNDQEPVRLLPKVAIAASGKPGATMGSVSATGHCGVELWNLKTLTDAGALSFSLIPVAATLADLTDPAKYPIAAPNRTSRSAPIETAVWQIQTTLKGYKLESDSDVHLQLDGAIGEIPDPACAQGSATGGKTSSVLPQITQARADFLAHYSLADECFDCLSVPVTIDGVGFFDHPHGQHGAAANQFELHPIIAISFGTAPPPPSPTVVSTTTSTTREPTSRGSCARWPRRHWYRHRWHRRCRRNYFTTP